MAGEKKRDLFYCMKCKENVKAEKVKEVTMKNGRPARKGRCPECETTVFKIGA